MAAKQVVAEVVAEVPMTTTPQNGDGSLTALMQLAIERLSGDNGPAMVETLSRLVDLQERVEAKKAEREFNTAMATFQAECPPISKTSTAKITTRGGASFQYKYAELDEIADTIRPLLKSLGLSYSWDTAVTADQITVTCTVRHIGGHSAKSSFQCPTDTKADMSGAQKNGAAVTYAKRQSLIAVLGLTTTEADTDGAAPQNFEKISRDQAANLMAMIDETKTDLARFLNFFDVADVSDLTTAQFGRAVAMLEGKRRAA